MLVKLIADRRQASFTAAHHAARRDMNQPRVAAFTPGGQMLDGIHVDALNLITLREMLDARGAVDRRHLLMRCGKACQSSRIRRVAFDNRDPSAEQGGSILAEVAAIGRLQALFAALSSRGTDEAVDPAVIAGHQLIQDMAAEIACRAQQQDVADDIFLAAEERFQGIARKQRMDFFVMIAVRTDLRRRPGAVTDRCGRLRRIGLLAVSAEESRHRARGGMVKYIVINKLIACFFGGDNDLHCQNGIAADFKEVILGADAFCAENTAEDSADILFRLALRRNERRLFQFRLRKRLFVDLLIDGQRDLIDLHHHGGHHIGGLLAFDILCERVDIDLAAADHERRQILAAALVIVRLYRDVADALKAADDRFDLLGLNAEAADLDLSVLSADKFDIAALSVADDVAGMVHAEFVEGAVLVCLRRLVGAVQISPADLRSRETVFACRAGRETVSRLVQDISVDGGNRLADRNIRLPLSDRENADAAAVLRRAVTVGDGIADAGGINGGKLFAAHDQQPQGFQLRIVLQELYADLRGQQQGGDTDLVKIRRQAVEVHTHLLGNEVNGAADKQGAEYIRHVDVKAERGVSRNIVVARVEGVAHTVRVGDDIAVLDLTALGRSC